MHSAAQSGQHLLADAFRWRFTTGGPTRDRKYQTDTYDLFGIEEDPSQSGAGKDLLLGILAKRRWAQKLSVGKLGPGIVHFVLPLNETSQLLLLRCTELKPAFGSLT